jgi:hypothetical protein
MLSAFIGCSSVGPTGHQGQQDYRLVSGYEEQAARDIAVAAGELGASFAPASAGGLAKSAAVSAASATPSLAVQWQGWTYAGGWWSRSGSFDAQGADGGRFLATGIDSVRFTDAAGLAVKDPIISTITGGNAARHGQLYARGWDGGYVNVKTDFSLNGTIDRAADTTLTLGGSVALWIDAESGDQSRWFTLNSSADASGITFVKQANGWSKPQTGTIAINGLCKNSLITFSNGIATIVITDNSGAEPPKTITVQL